MRSFTAAFSRRCCARSKLFIVSLTEDESTANIGALIRKQEPLCGPCPNFGAMPVRWPYIRQQRPFAMADGRTALVFENVLRLGTVAPIDVQSVSFAAATSQIELSGIRDEPVRNDVDYLTDNRVYCLRCFRAGGLFHSRVGYTEPARKATLNCIPPAMNGMRVVSNTTKRTVNYGSPTSMSCSAVAVVCVYGSGCGVCARSFCIRRGYPAAGTSAAGLGASATECAFDGKNLGKHVGGYLLFEFELTDLVKWGEDG